MQNRHYCNVLAHSLLQSTNTVASLKQQKKSHFSERLCNLHIHALWNQNEAALNADTCMHWIDRFHRIHEACTPCSGNVGYAKKCFFFSVDIRSALKLIVIIDSFHSYNSTFILTSMFVTIEMRHISWQSNQTLSSNKNSFVLWQWRCRWNVPWNWSIACQDGVAKLLEPCI